MPTIDAFLGLLAALLIVYGLDFWTQNLREAAYRSLDINPYYWGSLLANLAAAAILAGLVWLTRVRGRNSPLVAWVYLLSGLVVVLSPILIAVFPASLPILADPQFRVLRISMLYTGAHSRLQFVGAFVAVLGALGISPAFNRWMLERLRTIWLG